jgi:hypothetical protein
MLDVFRRAHYAGNFMRNSGLSATIATVALAISVPVVCEADDATLLRVFLKDGTSLVSYGEPARVADRVIFSMPTASTPNPPLHLVDLSVERVDWERTERYANGARTAHYIATQADSDYAELSNQITQVLNDVSLTPEPVKRLAIVEGARKMLADWPQNHYNYRQAEVRQMLMMLDEAIADPARRHRKQPLQPGPRHVHRDAGDLRAAAAGADAAGSDRRRPEGRAGR